MTDDGVVETLQDLGLTEYQSRAYVAAVRLGTARPNDLAEESGVPQARIYDVIDDLAARGLVEVHQRSRGKEVSAPPPERALDGLKRRHVEEFTDTVEDAAGALSRLHEQTRTTEAFVSMINHRESAVRHAERAIDAAEWWLTLSLSPDRYRRLEDEVASAIDRGVTVRLVLRSDGEADSVEELPEFSFPEELAVRYRELADTFVLADRQYGIYSSARPSDSDDAQPYFVMQEPNLVLVFQSYAEQIWPASAVVSSDDGFPRRYLDPWHAIADLRDELDAGEPFAATVEGRQTDTGRSGAWSGPIRGYELEGPTAADYAVAIPVTASLLIDTDEGRLSVGGWKARIEDVAADGVEIDRIDGG